MSITPDGIRYAETMADGKFKMQGLMDPRQGIISLKKIFKFHVDSTL